MHDTEPPGRSRPWRRLRPLLAALAAGVAALVGPAAASANVTGVKHVMVLRVYFHDYAQSSHFSQSTVQGLFDNQLNTLWKNNSYGRISLSTQVTPLYQLPKNRSSYVDDFSDGDLSNNGKFDLVLKDAIASVPQATNQNLTWSNLDAIVVLMAETDTSQFHRGQGTHDCTLPMGPGGSNRHVGCAIFSENPGTGTQATWGRFAHEIGHAFQENSTPAHPSNYQSSFELMDALYPGQTGVFEKQVGKAFTGWLPDDHYQNIVPRVNGAAPSWAPPGSALGGALVNLKAEEYDPAKAPNLQAARVYISKDLYYLVSVRRKMFGDELNPIPSEGVLIERVVEGGNTALNDCSSSPTPCPRWVEVKGPSGNAQALWTGNNMNDRSYFGDGALISVRPIDADNWQVRISYDLSPQPDVMVSPWRSPPLNAWESTDIWVDSPLNGYGSYRYGTVTSLEGDTVPRGNGDDPGVGQQNRLYARVRNLGTTDATDVVVHFDRTDPEGRGINGSNGFIALGTVTKAQFPQLADIPPGGFVDVYTNYTPAFTPTPQQIAQGRFNFHTCVRVRIDAVSGETVLGNQDGDGEQENIDSFEATNPSQPAAPLYASSIHLRNDDPTHPKWLALSWSTNLPRGWRVRVAGDRSGVLLGPGEERDIAVRIVPPRKGKAPKLGSAYAVDVQADYDHDLYNLFAPSDARAHWERKPLGGVRIVVRVVKPVKITCKAVRRADGQTLVSGRLIGAGRANRRVFVEGFYGPQNVFLPRTGVLLKTRLDGRFRGLLGRFRDPAPTAAVCLYAGNLKLAPTGAGPVPIS